MKKGSNFLRGLLTTIVMLSVMAGSMFLGYRFLKAFNPVAAEKIGDAAQTAKDKTEEKLGIELTPSDKPEEIPEVTPVDETEKESGVKVVDITPEKKPYTGIKLYETDGYFFNDNGEVLTNFHDNDPFGMYVYFDADRKYGVILKNRNCYLVEADLTFKQIASGCSCAGISYDGTTVYYISSSAGLWLYNTETGEETFLSDNGSRPRISPDGKTIVYNDYLPDSKHGVVIGGIGKEPVVIDEAKTGMFTPLAVNNGGNIVFYELYSGNDNGFYCYENGESRRINKEYAYHSYFDRSCEKVLYTDNEKVWYFESGLDVPVELADDMREIEIVDADVNHTGDMVNDAIVGVDNLADAVILDCGDKTYCLSKDCTSAVQLRDGGYACKYAMTSEGPTCLYKQDGVTYKAVYKSGDVDETIISEKDRILERIEYVDGFSEGFILKLEYDEHGDDFKLYYFKEGEEDVLLDNCGEENVNGVVWDELFGKCYYTCDGELRSINKDGSQKTTVATDVDYLIDYVNSDEVAGYEGSDGKYYIVINNNVSEK